MSKITFFNNNTVVFNGMSGKIVNKNNPKELLFLHNIAHISTHQYDHIYELDDGWAGGYLFIKGNQFQYFKCGSGRPGNFVASGTLF